MDQLLQGLTTWINKYADIYDDPLAVLPSDLVHSLDETEVSEETKPILKKLDELEQDETLSPEFVVEGFVGDSFTSSFEFTIDKNNLSNFVASIKQQPSSMEVEVKMSE
jgi:hypothetical protein